MRCILFSLVIGVCVIWRHLVVINQTAVTEKHSIKTRDWRRYHGHMETSGTCKKNLCPLDDSLITDPLVL